MSEFVRDQTWAVNECVRIIDETRQIVARGKETFMDKNVTVEFGAARMAVIDLATAMQTFDPEFREQHQEIPWRQVARSRDKFAHHYEDINRDLVWDTIETDFPELARRFKGLISPENE